MPFLGLSLERQPPGPLEGQCLGHQLQATCGELGDMAEVAISGQSTRSEKSGWNIHLLEVTNSKSSTVRYSDWKVGKDCK